MSVKACRFGPDNKCEVHMKRTLMLLLTGLCLVTAPAFAAPDQSPKKSSQQKKAKSQFTCEGKRYCKEMRSCAEARFYLEQCGVRRLDRDRDGIPCESICG
ncbi:excalibur calcium-binding domain-containing protein [Laribacter hongkongensis]|uniref:excalibur calcium-binding domain-containing protein n=1 Tax=Laribacter hongkongensis TaxID=168471 RepID=UPI001EFE13AB|nr:excalibur calcium-binding domain-containing protein [Laribacter hongkongensis]MCG8998420.1 excalibur calcium-binding domain-containing protein [Laribacter hongkongensis]MCG9013589.1 excalibur calcium-binding domain-containing protein [Laribacter hongkongensis]